MLRVLPEPPMDLGETLKGKDADGNLINNDKLGQICYFDYKTSRAASSRSSGKPIGAVLLRNTSGLTLLGKRFGQLSVAAAGTDMLHVVDGYTAAIAPKNAILIDPYLTSNGVADDDIFWGLFSGPALVLLPLASTAHTADIALNDPLVGATGTTSGATTSGRVTHVRFTNATAGETGAAFNAFNMIYGCVGRAMSARTSQETTAGADLLVDLAIKLFGPN